MSSIDAMMATLIQDLGADLYGIADLSGAQAALAPWGGDLVTGYPRCVSIGIRLMNAIVDGLARRDRLIAQNYRQHGYDLVNARLDAIASRIGCALQGMGYRALPIPASGTTDTERLYGTFSHKMGARLAGLGWIGKSCLLVTPEYGPRVRWTTILTDASLRCSGPPMAQGCGDCHECVSICPVRALTGRPFREDEPRQMRYDAQACSQYLASRQQEVGMGVCGLCLYVCPYGRRAT